jgi:hypothetical protein
MLTLAEVSLIYDYRSVAGVKRAEVVRRYAQMMNLSPGRAEDALDLWVHILGSQAAA